MESFGGTKPAASRPLSGLPATRRDSGRTGPREARVAVAIAAALYVAGAALTATSLLLPQVEAPLGVFAVAGTAVLTAGLLTIAVLRRRASLELAFLADLWGVVLIAVLCASTGGTSSPFGLIYFFALGHAAAFQPRRRLLVVSVAVLVAFLAPLVYMGAPETFGAIACVGIALGLLAATVIHVGFERMRAQRHSLQFLIEASAQLDTSLDPQETLRKIAATAVPELAELCVIDLLDTRGSIGDSVAAAIDPASRRGSSACAQRARWISAATIPSPRCSGAAYHACSPTSPILSRSRRSRRARSTGSSFAGPSIDPQRCSRWSPGGAPSGSCPSCTSGPAPIFDHRTWPCWPISPGARRWRSTMLACMPNEPTSRARCSAA